MLVRLFTIVAVAALLAASANAQGWGDIEADFFLKGSFTPEKIIFPAGVCGAVKLVRENVVVDPQTKGIKNIAMYLLPSSDTKPRVHSDYAKSAADKITLDNRNCKFIPHVTVLRTTQTLVLTNNDAFGHNCKAEFFNNASFNDLIPAGGKVEKKFANAERAFARFDCSIHPWMNGHVMITDHPYVQLSDAKGHLVMKNVPAGEWTFVVWQENTGYLSDVIVDGKPTKWTRGRIKLTVKPGVNNLGKIEVEPAALKIK